jgi:5-methylcytosine-specific restriction endonuclease McrA
MTPLFDFTSLGEHTGGFMGRTNQTLTGKTCTAPMNWDQNQSQNQKPIRATKRSVSETKKKYVASNQNWKCGSCAKQLNAWFEVDHRIRLDQGGSNDVTNLVALCRECHGGKTAMENM